MRMLMLLLYRKSASQYAVVQCSGSVRFNIALLCYFQRPIYF